MERQSVKIHDKLFRMSIPFEEIDARIQHLADRMNRELRDKNPLFLGILNGAFMFAADLFKKLDFPCEISFVKIASYEGTDTSGNVRELIGIDQEVKGRVVVVLEDIVDTGLTMKVIFRQLKRMQAADVKVATLLFKPEAFRGDFTIDYVGMEIPNEFIVGYGLDYLQQGRNYKNIYTIKE